MRQVVGLIPTYSSDEFGICSALYELGGMVVMHDASGCNSTYTTHDEPRWYDIDSMIFISAISEMEAIMGDDNKLIEDVIETAKNLQPNFIALVGAPIPYMIGTDLPAIARIIEAETKVPCFGLEANGMHHYTKGISMALEAFARRFCTQIIERSGKTSVNILGATPLDFSLNGSVESIREWLLSKDMEVNACFAMGSSLEELKQASKAEVNLVISYGGLSTAKLLQERFGTPYVVGIPFGKKFSQKLAYDLKRAAKKPKETLISYSTFLSSAKRKNSKEELEHLPVISHLTEITNVKENQKILMIGESVFCASLATALEISYGKKIFVATPLDTKEELLRDGDKKILEEDDLLKLLQDVDILISDPFYQVLCPQTATFIPLPHEAFSGRIYDSSNPNLIEGRMEAYFQLYFGK